MESGFLKDKNAEKTSDSTEQKREPTQESKPLVHIPQHKDAEKTSMSLFHIPQEIIENILFRVPVMPLCRFKSVCQTWNSWISNLKFNTQSVLSIIETSQGRFFHSEMDEGTSTVFPVPQDESDSQVFVSNSCNGMVLISIGISFYLCDPSTRYFTKVLELNHQLGLELDWYYMRIGLYHDETIRDFKAVVLVRLADNTHCDSILLVEARLKEKRWNHVDHTFKPDDYIKVGPVMNGRLHWLAGETVTCFDPILNKFEELPSFQPPTDNKKRRYRLVGIGVLEGFLCVSRIRTNNIEVFTMKEYVVLESWTLTFSFSHRKLNLFLTRLNPLLRTRGGEILIYLINEILVYKPGKRTFELCDLPMNGHSTCAVLFADQNMDMLTGYYWNKEEHANFGNTEDTERIRKYWNLTSWMQGRP